MNDIVMIPVGQLHHHPENPRLDLGDLTELAESIKANGVMQNLTVVRGHRMSREEWTEAAKAEGVSKDAAAGTYNPEEAWSADGYTVVIGNRRMEASKQAGVAEVPCVISDMDHRTQVSTMLMENMQRADLTVYEQAQGFQMMMDLGYTPKEIGEKTGFSETTVNRRLKMAELDKKTFQNAVGKQISMEDLDRLGQVEDLKTRNELLSEYGDRDFEWKLNIQIKKQKAEKVRQKAMEMLKAAKLKTIKREDTWKNDIKKLYDKTCELDKWDGKKAFIPKTEEPLFYFVNGMDIEFYIKEKRQRAEPVKRTQEEIEEEKLIDLAWKTADRVTQISHDLRADYAEKLTVKPSNAMQMLRWTIIAAMSDHMDHNYQTGYAIRKSFGITGTYTWDYVEELKKQIMKTNQSQWPLLIMILFEGLSEKPENIESFATGYRKDFPKHKRNTKLEQCYEWLTEFGYQMSTEEIQMMSGTHPCFQTKMEGV